VVDRLARVFRATAGLNAALAQWLTRLLGDLDKDGIGAIPLKGPVAACTLYGNLALRQFGDLDLLVRREHVPRALRRLGEAGSHPWHALSPRKVETLLRNRNEVAVTGPGLPVVDLHWEAVGRHLAWCGREELWERSVGTSLAGFAVQNLGPMDSAFYFCAKAVEGGWRAGYQLIDALRALRSLPQAAWDEVLRRAHLRGRWRMIAVNALLIEPLAPDVVPRRVTESAQRDRKAVGLASEACRKLCAAEAGMRSFPVQVLEEIAHLERRRDKARRLCALALKAGENDLALLPDWLCRPPVIQCVRLARSAGKTIREGLRIRRLRAHEAP
jgi:hypothetical protein